MGSLDIHIDGAMLLKVKVWQPFRAGTHTARSADRKNHASHGTMNVRETEKAGHAIVVGTWP